MDMEHFRFQMLVRSKEQEEFMNSDSSGCAVLGAKLSDILNRSLVEGASGIAAITCCMQHVTDGVSHPDE
jgi:hypothetical protein